MQSKPAACEVLEDGVDDTSNVLKSSREGVIALLAHRIKGPCRSLCLFPGYFQLLLPFPFLCLLSSALDPLSNTTVLVCSKAVARASQRSWRSALRALAAAFA